MRCMSYVGVSAAFLCVAAYTATAAVYGWEAEDFDSSEGDPLSVFDVPFTTTASTGVEFTIDEARGDQFMGTEDAGGPIGGYFTLTRGISLPAAGDWHFWMRAIGPPTGDNSFFWTIDGALDIGGADMNIQDFHEAAGASNNFPFGDSPTEEQLHSWAWYRFGSREGPFEGGGDEPVPINLSAGFHAFNLAGREDGAFLDMVFATTDPDFDANATPPPASVDPVDKLTTTWASMKAVL